MRNYIHKKMELARRDGCSGCTFWQRMLGIEVTGQCRTSPPRNEAEWPLTGYNEWCGHFHTNEPGDDPEEEDE